ncbi:MAG: M20/M25/M40 family metallo-hydrolase, partial [Candidatus Paceibacteria bacterium]
MHQNVNQYIQTNKERFLEELFEFLRIPSISASSERKPDVRKTAEFVRRKLEEAGVDHAHIYETPGNPIVYAEQIIDSDKPTVLVYGHYDVQPTDPEEEWEHAPFEPYIDEQNMIRARGASDDKGQLFMHIKALEFLNQYSELPCNMKFIFEGEEEIGSPHIEAFAREHADMLAADVLLVSDTGMVSNEQPSIPV